MGTKFTTTTLCQCSPRQSPGRRGAVGTLVRVHFFSWTRQRWTARSAYSLRHGKKVWMPSCDMKSWLAGGWIPWKGTIWIGNQEDGNVPNQPNQRSDEKSSAMGRRVGSISYPLVKNHCQVEEIYYIIHRRKITIFFWIAAVRSSR